MKHLHHITFWLTVSLIFLGCNIHPPKSDKDKDNSLDLSNNTASQSVERLNVAFVYPVVEVNGRRIKNLDPFSDTQSRITISYPKNSTHDIRLSFMDSEGVEQVLTGRVHIRDYTLEEEIMRKEGVVVVAPENPEYTYESILKNGYAQMTLREYSDNSYSGKPGPVLVDLELGSRNQKRSDIEFQFREGIIATVEGKDTPQTLIFAPNTKNIPLHVSMSDSFNTVRLQGSMDVYDKNNYTQMAPVVVDLGYDAIGQIRAYSGELNIALYVPVNTSGNNQNYVTFLRPGENPEEEGHKRGKVIALLKLKEIRNRN